MIMTVCKDHKDKVEKDDTEHIPIAGYFRWCKISRNSLQDCQKKISRLKFSRSCAWLTIPPFIIALLALRRMARTFSIEAMVGGYHVYKDNAALNEEFLRRRLVRYVRLANTPSLRVVSAPRSGG